MLEVFPWFLPGDFPAHLPGGHLTVPGLCGAFLPGSVPTLLGSHRLTVLLWLGLVVGPGATIAVPPLCLPPEPFEAPSTIEGISRLPLEYPGGQEGFFQFLLGRSNSEGGGCALEEGGLLSRTGNI